MIPLALTVLVGAASSAAAAGPGALSARRPAKSSAVTELLTDATVHPDGSMDVTEKITYVFTGGPFNFGVRSFAAQSASQISGFTATDQAGSALETIPPSQSVSGQWEWRLGGISDTTETYTLAYRVTDAVHGAGPTAELYWQFLGSDHDGLDHVHVTIHLPASFPVATASTPATDTTVLRAWGHGPRQGTVDVQPDRVELDVSNVPATRFVEARLIIPAAPFPRLDSAGAPLDTVLAEEGAAVAATLSEDAAGIGSPAAPRTYPHAHLGSVLILLGLLLGALATALAWWFKGREPKPDPMIGEYWREPLDDAPAIVLANMTKGSPAIGPIISSTLIDLAQRGYLTIREEAHERLGPDKVTHRFVWAGKDLAGVALYEREILENIFQGRNDVTTDDVTGWARSHRSQAQTFTKLVQSAVRTDYDAKQYRIKAKGLAAAAGGLVATIPAITGIVAWRLGSKAFVMSIIGAFVLALVTSQVVVNRTQAGADEEAKAEALKRYLKDFSNLKEAPVGHLILWERFLVYAVTLGVAKELIAGLRVALPSVADDPNFGTWYWGVAGASRFEHFGAFAHDFSRSTSTAYAPPSQTGSSGGFSSGGGGGGGGGGFSAR
jgi:hypothetical protein